MKITILCSDADHPVNAYLAEWIDQKRKDHTIELVRKHMGDCAGGGAHHP
jgi:hypothetical protein